MTKHSLSQTASSSEKNKRFKCSSNNRFKSIPSGKNKRDNSHQCSSMEVPFLNGYLKCKQPSSLESEFIQLLTAYEKNVKYFQENNLPRCQSFDGDSWINLRNFCKKHAEFASRMPSYNYTCCVNETVFLAHAVASFHEQPDGSFRCPFRESRCR